MTLKGQIQGHSDFKALYLTKVAFSWSSSSVTIFRFTVDGLDPTPKLFLTLYYYEILSSVYVDVDLNKHAYIPVHTRSRVRSYVTIKHYR